MKSYLRLQNIAARITTASNNTLNITNPTINPKSKPSLSLPLSCCELGLSVVGIKKFVVVVERDVYFVVVDLLVFFVEDTTVLNVDL